MTRRISFGNTDSYNDDSSSIQEQASDTRLNISMEDLETDANVRSVTESIDSELVDFMNISLESTLLVDQYMSEQLQSG